MKPRSLRRLLILQWSAFAAALLLGFGLFAVLALYILEDSFIDERLLAAEQAVLAGHEVPPPARLLRLDELPAAQHARLAALRARTLVEFRADPERYLHVRVLPADAEGPRFLAIEVQDAMRVNPALRRAAPTLAAVLLGVLALAAWLAKRFVSRIERAMQGLLTTLDHDTDLPGLRRALATQPVTEFRHFGQALAGALESRYEALQRETDTLRFLAHELRTPLQSARLALSNLPPSSEGARARARLERSLRRLERASEAVLWLGEQAPGVAPRRVAPIARALMDELQPLAAQRGQTMTLQETSEWALSLPPAALEAALGNLLLNAIQHGGPGPIRMQIDAQGLTLENPCEPAPSDGGFGLGLSLARRLLARAGCAVDASRIGEHFRLRVHPAAPDDATLDSGGPRAQA